MKREVCRHTLGAERCRWCKRLTCDACHHGQRHLDACPDTVRTELRGRR